MEGSQENDEERKRREILENARVGYQVAANLEANEVRALWSRFSAMLTANSIAIGVIGWSLNSVVTKGCSILIVLPVVMSLFGLFLCRAWYLLIVRKQKYCMYLMLSARELERKHLHPVVQTLDRGARFVGENAYKKGQESTPEWFGPEQIRIEAGNRIIPVELDRSESHKTNRVARTVIKVFGVLYALLLLYAVFIGFSRYVW